MEKQKNNDVQQTSMFLELEGFDGGSKVKGYENQFDLVGVEHSITYPTHLGDVPTEDKESLSYKALVEYKLFKVQIIPNYSYTQLMNALFDAKVISKAVFTAVESNVEMLKIEFENVQIREFTMQGDEPNIKSAPGDTENSNENPDNDGTRGEISFSYDSMKFIYTSTNKELGEQGKAVVEAKLDVYRG